MKTVEFYVTLKVTCEHDEQGYWGDLTLDDVKRNALSLIHPNYNTKLDGVKLTQVHAEFHDQDDVNTDFWNFYPEAELK